MIAQRQSTSAFYGLLLEADRCRTTVNYATPQAPNLASHCRVTGIADPYTGVLAETGAYRLKHGNRGYKLRCRYSRIKELKDQG